MNGEDLPLPYSQIWSSAKLMWYTVNRLKRLHSVNPFLSPLARFQLWIQLFRVVIKLLPLITPNRVRDRVFQDTSRPVLRDTWWFHPRSRCKQNVNGVQGAYKTKWLQCVCSWTWWPVHVRTKCTGYLLPIQACFQKKQVFKWNWNWRPQCRLHIWYLQE